MKEEDIADPDKDLEGMGQVFQRLFGSEDGEEFEPRRLPMDETMIEEGETDVPGHVRKKRGKSSRAIEGMPLYLTSMISALTNRCNDEHNGVHRERYENIGSVLSDLKTALAKFDIYLRQFDRERDEASLLNYLSDTSVFLLREADRAVRAHELAPIGDELWKSDDDNGFRTCRSRQNDSREPNQGSHRGKEGIFNSW